MFTVGYMIYVDRIHVTTIEWKIEYRREWKGVGGTMFQDLQWVPETEDCTFA